MSNFLSSAIEKLLFRPVVVSAIERVGDTFYLVSMQGEGLSGVTWIPGQTIQFMVGSLVKRAYTPMDVDAKAGSARFLFYRHGQGPGSAWAASLQEGDVCQVMRPKNSIDFTKEQGPAVFFGDETSFAAAQVLQQFQQERASGRLIFEVGSLPEARVVVSAMKLEQVTLLEKTSDGSHLEQAAKELNRLASLHKTPTWFFTGCAPSIQVVRKRLKANGVSLSRGAVKPYWSPGRKGID
jgi:NADPH-dependent ferric siderophore reductase